MPTVPQARVGAVRTQAQPTVFQDTRGISPEAFGAGQARGSQQVSQALGGLGNQLTQRAIQIQEEDNRREAKRMDVEFANAINESMFGVEDTPGFYSTKGEQVTGTFYQDSLKELEKKRLQVQGTTQNKRVQQMFDEAAQARILRESGSMSRHVAKERMVASNATSEAVIAEAGDDAARYFNEPARVQQAVATVNAEVTEMGNRLGWNAEVTKTKRGEALSALHMAVIESKLAVDPSSAEDYYKKNKKQIDGRLDTTIKKRLEAGSVRQKSQQAFDKITTETAGEQSALNAAKKIKDPKVRDETTSRVRQHFNDVDRIRRREERDQFDAMTIEAAKGVAPREEDMVTMTHRNRTYVKGIYSQWQSERADPDFQRSGDGGRSYESFRETQRDPVKLGNMSLEDLKAKFELGVKKATWEKTILPAWVNSGIALNKSQAKKAKATDPTKFLGLTWTARKNKALEDAGVEKQEERSTAFLEEFDTRFNNLPESQRTMDGRQSLLDQMVLESKTSEFVVDQSDLPFGLGGDTIKAPFLMTSSEKETFASDIEIPESERISFVAELDNMRSQLRQRGLNVTRQRVKDTWDSLMGRTVREGGQR